MFPHGDFLEIFCDCPLEVCEQRDVKGLYHRARAGVVKNFTGINSPYEPPEQPELRLETGKIPLEECVEQVIELLVTRGLVAVKFTIIYGARILVISALLYRYLMST